MKKLLLLLTVSSVLFSCSKKADPVKEENYTGKGDVMFNMNNVAGSEALQLDSKWYTTPNGDSIKFSKYNYYLSNFTFIEASGKEHKIEDSYFLIMQNKRESFSFSVKGLDAGKYTKVRFLIGVDSARNVSGVQSGALDPVHGMFWDWNTGYIMAMIEGQSPQSTLGGNLIAFHLGGFSGQGSALRYVEMSLPSELAITNGALKTIEMKADVMEWFKSPKLIDIAQLTTSISTGGSVNVLADNYVDMFTITSIK